MPYNLQDDNLWNKGSVITYNNRSDLRDSESLETNALFLVKWASELYGEWATWIKKFLPGCVCSYKSNTGRIVSKIEEMY